MKEKEFDIRHTLPPEDAYLLNKKSLTELANIHTCDKGTEWYEKHGYTEIYGKYIPERGLIHLLEIGIWHGDSIRMWLEWNKDLWVDAIDIDKNVLNYIQSTDRSEIYIGNITDKEFVNSSLGDSFYDVIIDDGSHNMMDILIGFKLLWNRVRKGGYYFIEDLHAAHARRPELLTELIRLVGTKDMNLQDARMFCDGKLLMLEKK